MLIDKPAVNTHAQIDASAAKHALTTGYWDDDAALQMVIQDTERAENYEMTKQWVMQWPTAAALYQSPFTARYWEGTQTERSNIPFYTVATAVESLVPQIMQGLFYEDPPFMVQERPGTSSQAARAVSAVLAYQLEEINFKGELSLGIKNSVLFGTGIFKWGWETYTRERKRYKRTTLPIKLNNKPGLPQIEITPADEEIEEEIIEEYIDRPTFEHIVNLRTVLVDPALNIPDIRKAKYVVHRLYMTWNELDRLRDRPGFVIPSKEELLELFLPPKEEATPAPQENSVRNPLWDARAIPRYEPSTIDPFNQPLEILERWDNNKYIVVLQRKKVICNDDNPYGAIPFLSVGWWDVPEAFWSMGLGKTIGSEQRLQQGIMNAWMDNISLNLNGVYVRVKGNSVPTQSIRISPGKIINVDKVDDFTPLKRLDAVPEAGTTLQLSQQRAETVSGASEAATQGVAGASGHSNLARSATGANLLAGGTGSRVQNFVEKLANQVIIPFLYQAHEMTCALMPMSTLKYILDEELQHVFTGDLVDILNSRLKISISAAARMQARRNMAQALPILVQFLMSEQTSQQLAISGEKVDVKEVLHMMFEVSDWRNFNDVITKMTPDDQKRHMMMNPQAQQAAQVQAKKEMQQTQFNQKTALIDQENIARAGREVLRSALERSATPEVLGGEPGGQAFGANA